MKKSILLFVFALFTLAGFAQAPKGLNYQGVARNSGGTVFNNGTPVTVTFSIRDGNAFGNIVFTETQSATTNQYGLFNLTIGSVNSASFGQIPWASGPKYLEVNINANGTQLPGVTTQLMSVPYALYAEKSGNSGTDSQTLSVSGNQLSISNGNTVNLPQDGDGNPTNEIQTLSVNGNQLSISGNGGNTVTLPAPTAVPDIVIFEERQNAGTNAGTANLNDFTLRQLNFVAFGDLSTSVSLNTSNHQITFKKTGKYLITASANAYRVNNHRLVLRDLANNILLSGMNSFNYQDAPYATTNAQLIGILDVQSANKIVKMDHFCRLSEGGVSGLGIAIGATSGQQEIYSQIMIQKIE